MVNVIKQQPKIGDVIFTSRNQRSNNHSVDLAGLTQLQVAWKLSSSLEITEAKKTGISKYQENQEWLFQGSSSLIVATKNLSRTNLIFYQDVSEAIYF